MTADEVVEPTPRNRRSPSGQLVPPTFDRPAWWDTLVTRGPATRAQIERFVEVEAAKLLGKEPPAEPETFTPQVSRAQLRAATINAQRRVRRARRAKVRAFVEARRTEPAVSRQERRRVMAALAAQDDAA